MVLVEMPSWVALIDANVFAVSFAQAIGMAPFGEKNALNFYYGTEWERWEAWEVMS
jgi:hypothetical protein